VTSGVTSDSSVSKSNRSCRISPSMSKFVSSGGAPGRAGSERRTFAPMPGGGSMSVSLALMSGWPVGSTMIRPQTTIWAFCSRATRSASTRRFSIVLPGGVV
jgi:hypothetical protein